MARVILLDHFDSFTWNVAHGLAEAGAEVAVLPADRTSAEALAERPPDLLVLSPGPGRPEAARVALEAVRRLAGQVPILGICLGHQVLATAFGGRVGRAPAPVHGKAEPVRHDGRGLFRGLPQPMTAGRYHSLVVTDLPADLEACAWSGDGCLMALRHRTLPIAGVQFHPDSFLTPEGGRLFRNVLDGGF